MSQAKTTDLRYSIGLLGILFSTYLALLKVVGLPCMTGGDCHKILESSQSTLFGLPVSLYSIVIWSVYISVSNRYISYINTIILVSGSLYFTFLQLFQLEGFCIFCFIHSILCFATIPLLFAKEYDPKRINRFLMGIILPNIFGIALVIIIAQKHWIEKQVSKNTLDLSKTQSIASEPTDEGALSLKMFPNHPANKNLLVVSPTCVACVEKLRSYELYLKQNPTASVPHVIWDSHGNKNLVELVICYLNNNDSLLPLMDWLDFIRKSDFRSDDNMIRNSFEERFPTYTMGKYDAIIEHYSSWLDEHPIAVVPSLIAPSGMITTDFSSSDMSNDDFKKAKLELLESDIDLGIRKSAEEITFSFSVKNSGTRSAKLTNMNFSSLPNGYIAWDKQTIEPNQKSTATVKWQIPDDYNGEAFARVAYNHDGVSFNLPVHVLVPLNGWVWPTIETNVDDLLDTTFEIKNILNNELTITGISSDIPGYAAMIKDSKTVYFEKSGETPNETESSLYFLDVNVSDGSGFKVPLRLHKAKTN